ncbi:MAG: DNA polymerase III subunit delta' C-terminal domain-containing protein, partial [Rhodococcus sp. (in: high G+C Gram-positive bacteria)]
VLKDLEKRQKSRATRTGRDSLDRALMDLVGLYRDALARSYGSTATATHPDMAEQVERMAKAVPPEALLKSIEAILECRESLAVNAKPKFAIYAMVATLGDVLR